MDSHSPQENVPQDSTPVPPVPPASGGEDTEIRKAPPRPTADRKRAARAGSINDLTPILKGWDYEPGTVNVRKVVGLDGSAKLQMRLDLGLLQMELTGRPDGQRPHGCESFLEVYEQRLLEHTRITGTSDGFVLDGDDCQLLRDEAAMYYRRYLSLFVLGEFAGVVRDTERNLRVLDLCSRFGSHKGDRLVLEQYRPYIIMMNTRAGASIQSRKKEYRQALVTVRGGLKKIRRFFKRFDQEEAYLHASEVKILRRFARDIQKKLPVDPMRKLARRLQRALSDERYEDAAKLRDEMSAWQIGNAQPEIND